MSSDIKIKTHIIVQSTHSSLRSESKIEMETPTFYLNYIKNKNKIHLIIVIVYQKLYEKYIILLLIWYKKLQIVQTIKYLFN